MERTRVQKLAYVLKILMTITFVCNLIALLLIPGYAVLKMAQPFGIHDNPFLRLPELLRVFVVSWALTWQLGLSYIKFFFEFFLSGVCTAVMIWQGRRVLDTILTGSPFCAKNGVSLRRSAVCCFCISAIFLFRVVDSMIVLPSIMPIFTFETVLVPLFFLGGLLCLVMSALFRQAAEMKAENDLTI